MADQRQSDVLGALPRTRPHRRSAKRPERPGDTGAKPATRSARPSGRTAEPKRPKAAGPSRSASKPRAVQGTRTGPGQVSRSRPTPGARTKAEPLHQPPQPRGIPSQPRSPVPSIPQRPEIVGTFVQAAAELTEIGLSLGAQVLRRAVSRLPRP